MQGFPVYGAKDDHMSEGWYQQSQSKLLSRSSKPLVIRHVSLSPPA